MFNNKKKHFQKKLSDIGIMLWDWEFKLHKVRLLREDIRKEHDRVVERLDALTVQIDKKDNKEETIAELTKQKEGSEKDLEAIKGQLTQLDTEGQQTQAGIDGLYELRKMVKDYITSC